MLWALIRIPALPPTFMPDNHGSTNLRHAIKDPLSGQSAAITTHPLYSLSCVYVRMYVHVRVCQSKGGKQEDLCRGQNINPFRHFTCSKSLLLAAPAFTCAAVSLSYSYSCGERGVRPGRERTSTTSQWCVNCSRRVG